MGYRLYHTTRGSREEWVQGHILKVQRRYTEFEMENLMLLLTDDAAWVFSSTD